MWKDLRLRLYPTKKAGIAPGLRLSSREAEVAATKTMLERTKERFDLQPQRLAADTAYGSGLMIGWLMRRGIEPHVPLLDRERQTWGFFTPADFQFDCVA